MKVIAIIAVLCFASQSLAAPSSTYSLEQDFQDFLKLVPADKVKALVFDYVANDEQVQEAIVYLHGDEFASIWKQITENNEFQQLVSYLERAGLHVVDLLNRIADRLDLPKYPAHVQLADQRTGGLNGLLEDILALLPVDKIKALYQEKLQSSLAFRDLHDKLSSRDFQRIVKFVKDSPELSHALNTLKEKGVDVSKIVEVIKKIFGWK